MLTVDPDNLDRGSTVLDSAGRSSGDAATAARDAASQGEASACNEPLRAALGRWAAACSAQSTLGSLGLMQLARLAQENGRQNAEISGMR